ncbi:hypothetical protein PGLA_00940 [Paenibacillus glacialis]|uniref:Uncharacterized protein n=1 Tax=Paenibacillus glacialis TaxID=494026 RepID=A0A168NPC3_9BACL|nr:hypothetical protein PGLA_00940 [Paenibacillus glacialis]
MDNKALQIGRLIYVCENYSSSSSLNDIVKRLISSSEVSFSNQHILAGFITESMDNNDEIGKIDALIAISNYFDKLE